MSQEVNLLVEKYLMGFKKHGEIRDVFVNPTKKELRELGAVYRFIADAARDKLYVFNADMLHDETWTHHIRKEIKDSRDIYGNEYLFAGVMEGNRIQNWGLRDNLYKDEVLEEWLDNPDMFDFTKKWGIDIEVWMKKNTALMEKYVYRN